MVTPSVEEFLTQRPRLFGLAYRMLGDAGEAEDVVQDAYLRWAGADRAEIVYPRGWLMKVVTNLCFNRLTSARARRESYIGPWLPEPVLTADGELGPLETVEQRDSVSLALLSLMERLTPVERAVFVLREAFAYSHRQIAEFLDVSEANSRQLHGRARQHLGAMRPRFEPDRAQWRQFVESFLAAARGGDVAELRELLAADVTATADGGGKVGAARRTVVGRDRVARYLAGALTRFAPTSPALFLAEVNGGPAVLGFADGQLLGVLSLEIVDGQVSAVHIVANPDKLVFVARQFEALSHLGTPLGS
ncbi:MAG: RNA polymerase sigma-70 factor [Pseudonocardiaceae bacterium]